MLFAPVIIKLQLPSESPGKLVKTQIADSTSRVFQSVNLGWGPWICICNQFPGTSNAAGPEITLWKPLPYALVPPQIGSMELTWEPAATAGSQAPVTQNLPANKIPRYSYHIVGYGHCNKFCGGHEHGVSCKHWRLTLKTGFPAGMRGNLNLRGSEEGRSLVLLENWEKPTMARVCARWG